MAAYLMSEKIQVLDGGFGTELEAAGYKVRDDPLWSAAALFDRPDLVLQTHKRFIEAGCDIILTNSYHASINTMMSSRGLTRTAAESFVKRSVSLAQQAVEECAVQRKVDIVGSIGSYAVTLFDASEYNGYYVDEVDEQVMVDYHVAQTVPLLQAGLNVIAYETIPSYKEALAILKAADIVSDQYKFWISFSCKDGERTNHDEPFDEAVRRISHHPKLLGVGINCTSPSYITSLLRSSGSSVNRLPFIIYPNSGEVYEDDKKLWKCTKCIYPSMEQLMEWKCLGVKVVGGCCRVTAEMIKELSEMVVKLNS